MATITTDISTTTLHSHNSESNYDYYDDDLFLFWPTYLHTLAFCRVDTGMRIVLWWLRLKYTACLLDIAGLHSLLRGQHSWHLYAHSQEQNESYLIMTRNWQLDSQVQLKKLEYREKVQYFLSLISESETHILYRFITQSEIFQAFISWIFDDYGLQIMKIQNSVSQKIWILHKINKKRIF